MLTPRFTTTHAITAGLTAIERARGFLEAATLSKEWVERMSQRALLLEAHYTTHIEGTQLTIAEAAQAWAGAELGRERSDDVRELLNYRGAFQLMSEYLNSGDPITEGLIRELHKRLVADVRGGEGGPGVYRTVQNYVAHSVTRAVVYTPPPPSDVPLLMRELVEFLEREATIHPVLVAGVAQFQLVHIHPFLDGNGRTSRLLSTLALYRAGYDFKRLFTLSEFYDRDRARFYQAIQAVRDQDMDLTGWLEYFVAGLATQLSEVKARGEVAIRADVVARERGLNARQAVILDLVLAQGGITLAELEARISDTSRRTLQRDLRAMVDKRLLREVAAAPTDPTRRYEPGPI